jgi:hypothetical protein
MIVDFTASQNIETSTISLVLWLYTKSNPHRVLSLQGIRKANSVVASRFVAPHSALLVDDGVLGDMQHFMPNEEGENSKRWRQRDEEAWRGLVRF